MKKKNQSSVGLWMSKKIQPSTYTYTYVPTPKPVGKEKKPKIQQRPQKKIWFFPRQVEKYIDPYLSIYEDYYECPGCWDADCTNPIVIE